MQSGRLHEQLSVSNNEKNLQTKQITVDHLELNVLIFEISQISWRNFPARAFLLVVVMKLIFYACLFSRQTNFILAAGISHAYTSSECEFQMGLFALSSAWFIAAVSAQGTSCATTLVPTGSSLLMSFSPILSLRALLKANIDFYVLLNKAKRSAFRLTPSSTPPKHC